MGTRIQGHTRVLAMARPSPNPAGLRSAPTASERAQAARALDAGLASACALATASGRRLEPVKTAIVRAILHRWVDAAEQMDAAGGTGTDLIVAIAGRGGVVIAAFGAWSAAAVAGDGVHWLPEWEWEEDPEEDWEEVDDAPRGLDDPEADRLAEVMWMSPRHHVHGLWLGPAGSLDDVAGPDVEADAVLVDITAALREASVDGAPDRDAEHHDPAGALELSTDQRGQAPELVPAWEDWVGEGLHFVAPIMVTWAPPATLARPVPLGEPEVMDHGAPRDSTDPARTTMTGSRDSSPPSSASGVALGVAAEVAAERSSSDGIRIGPIAAVVAVVLAILAVPAWALSRPNPPTPTTPLTPVVTTSSSIAGDANPSPTPSVSESASQSASPSGAVRTPTPTRLASRAPASSTASTEPSAPQTSASAPTPTTPAPTATVTSTPDPTTPSPTTPDPTESPTPSP
ncbi:MAG: hypothetical protein KBB39_05775 [Phycicoccus sp.]|nr:hypothetical protein [Phycicoccus sp.]